MAAWPPSTACRSKSENLPAGDLGPRLATKSLSMETLRATAGLSMVRFRLRVDSGRMDC